MKQRARRWIPGRSPWLAAFFLATSVIVITGGPAWGQASAAISGAVDDATGTGISDATVTVKSLETGASRVVTTDKTGEFKVASLPLGPQEIKAEKTGFKA